MSVKIVYALIIGSFPALFPVCHGETDMVLTGRIVGVHDGDSATLLVKQRQYKIRLVGIDAPELGQDYGKKSKEALASMIFGKGVAAKITDKDKYGRHLGQITVGVENVNLAMVAQGWAWQFTKYDKCQELKLSQQHARQQKKGLWAGEVNGIRALPPWEFRERQRTLSKTKRERRMQTQGEVKPDSKASPPQFPQGGYWLNTSSGTRHNPGCHSYHNTKRGKPCGSEEGKACGICGG